MPYFQRPPLEGTTGTADLASAATDIVQRATAILDRESPPPMAVPLTLPAGVPLAATSGIGMFPVSGDQIEARMDQLRRQAGDVIENLLTLAIAAASGGPASPASGMVFPSLPTAPSRLAEQAPLLRPTGSVKAGDIAKIPLTVFNESPGPVDICFYGSDLVSDSGFGIPASKLTFSPRMLTLPAKERSTIEVNVPIPEQAPRGLYAGLVQATGLDSLRAVVTIPVE